MTEQEILSELCYYDKRNPDCTADDEAIEDYNKRLLKRGNTCSCDNCFYGRTKMAEYILDLRESVVQLKGVYDTNTVLSTINYNKIETLLK